MFYLTLKTEKPDRNGNARAVNVFYSAKTGEALGLCLVNSAGASAAACEFSELIRMPSDVAVKLPSNPLARDLIKYAYPLSGGVLEAFHITPRQYRRLCFMLNGDWAAVFKRTAGGLGSNYRRGPGAPKITEARLNGDRRAPVNVERLADLAGRHLTPDQ